MMVNLTTIIFLIVFYYLCVIFYAPVVDYLASFLDVKAAKVHEGKGDAYVNSAMFLSIEDDY